MGALMRLPLQLLLALCFWLLPLGTTLADGNPPHMKLPAATGVTIPNSTDVAPPGDLAWTRFERFEMNGDLAFKGTLGWGANVGWISAEHGLFFDVAFNFYAAHYGSFQVFQPGVGGDGPNNFGDNSEVGRTRSSTDTGTLLTLGPGIGRVFSFFRSEKWIQSARFGLGYGQYNDTVNGITLRGPLASFHFEAGYVYRSVIFAPGITWNLAYMARTQGITSDEQAADDYPQMRYLPLEWFTMGFAVYVWF